MFLIQHFQIHIPCPIPKPGNIQCNIFPYTGTNQKANNAQRVESELPHDDDDDELHEVICLKVDSRVRKAAMSLQDQEFLAKLSAGYLIALVPNIITTAFLLIQ